MKLVKKLIATLLAFVPIAVASAQQLSDPLGNTSIQQLLSNILNTVVLIGVPVLVMAVVFVGFMYVKAQGNPEQLKTAHSAFFWTIIGALVVLGAKVISSALCGTAKNLGASNLPCS